MLETSRRFPHPKKFTGPFTLTPWKVLEFPATFTRPSALSESMRLSLESPDISIALDPSAISEMLAESTMLLRPEERRMPLPMMRF